MTVASYRRLKDNRTNAAGRLSFFVIMNINYKTYNCNN